MIPPKRPTVCSLCGGRVEHVPNRKAYGIKRAAGGATAARSAARASGRTRRGRRRRSGFWPTAA